MLLTRCHAFPFPATRGHLPRGATFAPNRRWPLVACTTVHAIHNCDLGDPLDVTTARIKRKSNQTDAADGEFLETDPLIK